MSQLDTGIGSYTLNRWPVTANDPLRAWDAADEYLLHHVLEDSPLIQGAAIRILLVNDSHGALAAVLHEWQPQSWGDSFISHRSATENLTLNNITNPLRKVPSTEVPVGPVDLVLIKVPKTTALLEDQLYQIRALCHSQTQVFAAGMVKHLHKSAFTALERAIGPVTTSLAKKKARLIFVELNAAIEPAVSPYPTQYFDEDVGRPLLNHANVFSREHLDHGSRFLLEHYRSLPAAEQVVDLACGNGVLGLLYQQAHPQASLSFVDESYSAIESARCNHAAWFPDESFQADFVAADGLAHLDEHCVDLVLCNPPFHQQHATGDRVARRLFDAAKRCLKQHGELWVVANRHLEYPAALRQLFGQCRTIASNRKFSVYRAVKR